MTENTQNLIEMYYEAAIQGSVSLLQELLRKDPLLLYRPLPPSNTSPLHQACMLGHTNFVLELLHLNPNLAEELDPNNKSSIFLHLAARNGHVELAKSLASYYPSLCFARDMLGRNPAHVAVVKGQLLILEELLKIVPAAARERVGPSLGTSGGDTILHLCVKNNNLEALKLAVRLVGDAEILNATNADGYTIFHVAVADKRLEIVKFLVREKRLNKNKLNSNGQTAMDILLDNPDAKSKVVQELKSALKPAQLMNTNERNQKKHLDWLDMERSSLMVVASLIATIAFQAGLNPPGGVWQDDKSGLTTAPSRSPAYTPAMEHSHYPGTSIWAEETLYGYKWFQVSNTVAFMSSMSSLLLLISGLHCKQSFMALIMVTLWVSASATTLCFLPSQGYLLPGNDAWEYLHGYEKILYISVIGWLFLLASLFVAHFIHGTVRLIKWVRRCYYLNFA